MTGFPRTLIVTVEKAGQHCAPSGDGVPTLGTWTFGYCGGVVGVYAFGGDVEGGTFCVSCFLGGGGG